MLIKNMCCNNVVNLARYWQFEIDFNWSSEWVLCYLSVIYFELMCFLGRTWNILKKVFFYGIFLYFKYNLHLIFNLISQ